MVAAHLFFAAQHRTTVGGPATRWHSAPRGTVDGMVLIISEIRDILPLKKEGDKLVND
jgi:hypothetical protein